MPVDPNIPAGKALVRFCHNLAVDKQPLTIALGIGGERLEATTESCAPAPKASCAAVNAGAQPVTIDVAALQSSFPGTVELEPGKAYMVWPFGQRVEGKIKTLHPWVFELPNAADCHGLDFKEADLRIKAPLALEPFRAEEFTVARPRGFMHKAIDKRTHSFESPNPRSLITSFKISYLGRINDAYVPEVKELLAKALADRGLTALGQPDATAWYVSTLADTGKPGPGRYLRLAYISRQDVAEITADRTTRATDLVTAEFAFADPFAEEFHWLPFTLHTILAGMSVPPDDLPVDQLVGTWQNGSGDFPTTDWVDSGGNYVGGLSQGTAFRFSFRPDGNYEAMTLNSAVCSGQTIGCVEGVVVNLSRGRFSTADGVLTLAPWRCEHRAYDGNIRLTAVGPCETHRIPTVLRIGRLLQGRLFVEGMSLQVTIPEGHEKRVATRVDGAPPPWTTTVLPADPFSKRPPADHLNICGLADPREENERPDRAVPLALGTDFKACAPTTADHDYYEVTAPADDPARPGFFEFFVSELGQGRLSTDVLVVSKNHESIIGIPGGFNRNPGEPLHVFWAATPGEKYRFFLKASLPGWFPYTVRAKYTRVPDVHEPNDSFETAKPLALGTPVEGYLFSPAKRNFSGTMLFTNDLDWFTVGLQAGTATIRLEQPPDDIRNEVHLQLQKNVDVFRHDPFSNGVPVNQQVNITQAGTYRIVVQQPCFPLSCDAPGYGGKVAGFGPMDGAVPTSYRRPYRLTVSQP